MQSNKTNMIVFLKDVESNLIEEAVIVVKEGINISENIGKKIDKKMLLQEAELIINNRKEENDKNFLKFKIEKLLKKNKKLKIINVILVILILIIFLV